MLHLKRIYNLNRNRNYILLQAISEGYLIINTLPFFVKWKAIISTKRILHDVTMRFDDLTSCPSSNPFFSQMNKNLEFIYVQNIARIFVSFSFTNVFFINGKVE